MDEKVPESQKWTELAFRRAAERAKLEQKGGIGRRSRKVVMKPFIIDELSIGCRY